MAAMSSRSRWKTLELAWAIAWAILAGSPLLWAERTSAQQFSVTSWGHKDGLASTTVYAVAQTGNGFLWLATGDGLIRFDGFQFLPPQSPGVDREALGPITALGSTGAAGLLIGTSKGVLIRREARTSARVVLDSAVERIQELADHTFRVQTLHKVYRLANTNLAILSAQDSQQVESAAEALSDRSLTATIRKTLRDTRSSN
jgi:ligand-binding sensor domain-containing protein